MAKSPKTKEEFDRLSLLVGKVFTPSAPVNSLDLFAGRLEQVRRVSDAVNQVGLHVCLYGQRGVGKTSLVNVLKSFLSIALPGGDEDAPQTVVVKVTCNTESTFDSVWRDAFQELQVVGVRRRAGIRQTDQTQYAPIQLDVPDSVLTPSDIRRILSLLGQRATLVLVIDEFDRIEDQSVRKQFADTIKVLSDHQVPATLLLVGVASSIEQLIQGHESVMRAIKQVEMPLMNATELREVIAKGMNALGLKCDDEARDLIVALSLGLPHYTHLLCLNAVRCACAQRQSTITRKVLVECAIPKVTLDASASIIRAYQDGIQSTKKESLYPKILLACALSERDEFGNFPAKEIAIPLGKILKKTVSIPNFSRNLSNLCSDDRGPTLLKLGHPKRYRYRFKDPLLQPYVISRGIAEGLIDAGDVLLMIRGNKKSKGE